MNRQSKVFLIKPQSRTIGLTSLLDQFDLSDYQGKKVIVKANFNSADPFPASTHLKTLEILMKELKKAGAVQLTLLERSGIGPTRKVLEKTGVFNLSKRLNFDVVVLEEIDRNSWVKISKQKTHWLRGFYLPKILLEADKVVQTCCLKTHRFGGHFTMSLKNSVGLVAKKLPGGTYDYMWELHVSPNQREMIAEINEFYKVNLVVMDAIQAFFSGGPAKGDLIRPQLLLASKDRVAIDAIGIAILRNSGSTKEVMKGPIFQQAQIRRAAEMGVGVQSASETELVPLNLETHEASIAIQQILEKQG